MPLELDLFIFWPAHGTQYSQRVLKIAELTAFWLLVGDISRGILSQLTWSFLISTQWESPCNSGIRRISLQRQPNSLLSAANDIRRGGSWVAANLCRQIRRIHACTYNEDVVAVLQIEVVEVELDEIIGGDLDIPCSGGGLLKDIVAVLVVFVTVGVSRRVEEKRDWSSLERVYIGASLLTRWFYQEKKGCINLINVLTKGIIRESQFDLSDCMWMNYTVNVHVHLKTLFLSYWVSNKETDLQFQERILEMKRNNILATLAEDEEDGKGHIWIYSSSICSK